ncbi:uncharacterized protein G2W53_017604 [Senna tora]|uniref:Uncharacterized protein n=1 Tax=Senna tora TaxID=362788 RepID=A0A834TQM8_9FABA|nr:uncharacterized protein G2W53_017604 [Senna tora]
MASDVWCCSFSSMLSRLCPDVFLAFECVLGCACSLTKNDGSGIPLGSFWWVIIRTGGWLTTAFSSWYLLLPMFYALLLASFCELILLDLNHCIFFLVFVVANVLCTFVGFVLEYRSRYPTVAPFDEYLQRRGSQVTE